MREPPTAEPRLWESALQPSARTEPSDGLTDYNHPLVTLAETMDQGADKAAELAAA